MEKEKKENPLRKFMDLNGLTLQQFSRLSRLSTTCVFDISEGKRKPTRLTAMKIAKATNDRVGPRDFGLN